MENSAGASEEDVFDWVEDESLVGFCVTLARDLTPDQVFARWEVDQVAETPVSWYGDWALIVELNSVYGARPAGSNPRARRCVRGRNRTGFSPK